MLAMDFTILWLSGLNAEKEVEMIVYTTGGEVEMVIYTIEQFQDDGWYEVPEGVFGDYAASKEGMENLEDAGMRDLRIMQVCIDGYTVIRTDVDYGAES